MINSTAIGHNAKVTASNQVVIGDENVTSTVLHGVSTLLREAVIAPSISCSPTIFVFTDNQRDYWLNYNPEDFPPRGETGDILVDWGIISQNGMVNSNPTYPPPPGKTGDILIDQYWCEIYVGIYEYGWILISRRNHTLGS